MQQAGIKKKHIKTKRDLKQVIFELFFTSNDLLG
jgi:hypothetical protein